MKFARLTIIIILLFAVSINGSGLQAGTGPDHPCLILRKADVKAIKAGIGKYSILSQTYLEARKIADKAIKNGIIVPVPADPGGGYTHEMHKQNYLAMYNAALVYQVSGEKKYAIFVRDMLLEYAALYPTLGLHPARSGNGPGKIFWQGLNDSVWLVYAIQAYDCIYDFMGNDQRAEIENNLFRRIVKFFTEEDSYSFNRVHNHGTWAVAGVGMTGIVLNEQKFIDMALRSTNLDGSGGFMKQISGLFSPDGYYSEGPYYQRYAILPFIIFAKALENNRPELNIFGFNNAVLTKAVTTVLQLTGSDGRFYPLNDALKEKSFDTPELVFATAITYNLTGNAELLDVIKQLGKTVISIDGLKAAGMIQSGQTKEFVRRSVFLRDGPDGHGGGVALMRNGSGKDQSSVVFKFTTQGMGHGHFDRLSYSFYDRGNEIFTDYGSVRFLNVESKDGGKYLPENKTWAVQTIAHNTVTVNGQSQYGASVESAEKYYPSLIYSDLSNPGCQVVSAADSNSYKDVTLQRTLACISFENKQFLIDLFRVNGKSPVAADLPWYYNGQITAVNFKYTRDPVTKNALGEKNGYQHLWDEAGASGLRSPGSITIMNNTRFYTLTFLTNPETEVMFVSTGANDPNFNLRNEKGIIVRQKKSAVHTFLSVMEAHGDYRPSDETVSQSSGSVKNIEILASETDCSLIKVTMSDERSFRLAVAHQAGSERDYAVSTKEGEIRWKGNYKLINE
jgi:hypothetical protein